MPAFFTVGRRYPRPRLTEWMESNVKVAGIIYNDALRPGVVICTSGGVFAQVAGFRDGPTDDGRWNYSGQQGGTRGPWKSAGNRKVRDSKLILLFLAHEPTPEEQEIQGNGGQWYEFCGAFRVHKTETIEQGERIAGTAEWHIVGERLLFVLEPCDPQCALYRELRDSGAIA